MTEQELEITKLRLRLNFSEAQLACVLAFVLCQDKSDLQHIEAFRQLISRLKERSELLIFPKASPAESDMFAAVVQEHIAKFSEVVSSYVSHFKNS